MQITQLLVFCYSSGKWIITELFFQSGVPGYQECSQSPSEYWDKESRFRQQWFIRTKRETDSYGWREEWLGCSLPEAQAITRRWMTEEVPLIRSIAFSSSISPSAKSEMKISKAMGNYGFRVLSHKMELPAQWHTTKVCLLSDIFL